ncbi:hypothetical protein D3C80_2021230 [compost metagenome]
MNRAQLRIIVPVSGRVDELGQGLWALLHEQLGKCPILLSLFDIVGEKQAVDYLFGSGLDHRNHDVFD